MDAADDHPRMFILDLGGGAALNVFEVRRGRHHRRAPRRRVVAARSTTSRSRSTRSRTLEAAKQRLVDAGADIGEIQRLGPEWSLFFRDVDGMELEVCAPAHDPQA